MIRLCYRLKHPHTQITSFVWVKILQQKINLQGKREVKKKKRSYNFYPVKPSGLKQSEKKDHTV